MATKSPSSPIATAAPIGVLAPDFILEIKSELELKEKQLELLPVEIAELKKKYEAALLFAPKGFNPDAFTASTSDPSTKNNATARNLEVVQLQRGKKVLALPKQAPLELTPKKTRKSNKESWRTGVLKVLDESGAGMPYSSVLDQARARFGFPGSDGEKGFYNAVARLIKDGSIVKHGSWLYSTKLVASIKKHGGELPPIPEHGRRSGSSSELLVAILENHPHGLSAPDLKVEVSKMPNAPKSLIKHGQYIYNILGTMIGAGEVIRDNGVYRLARNVGA